ncbi:MAG: RNA-binding protein [Bdellovibrionales bacterium]
MGHTFSDQEAGTLTDLKPSERRCLVCKEDKPKSELIRFVLGPDRRVVPDLAERLPGRGLWVSADQAALSEAISKNLFSRAAKTKAFLPDNLLAQVETLLAKRCLDLLGLARGAGVVVTGQPQVEQALSKGVLAFVLFAKDAGRDCRKKLSQAQAVHAGFSRDELGAALGYEHLAAIGLKPHALTQKLKKECARWQGVTGAQHDDRNEDWIA